LQLPAECSRAIRSISLPAAVDSRSLTVYSAASCCDYGTQYARCQANASYTDAVRSEQATPALEYQNGNNNRSNDIIIPIIRSRKGHRQTTRPLLNGKTAFAAISTVIHFPFQNPRHSRFQMPIIE
jgi:hypothetical protein